MFNSDFFVLQSIYMDKYFSYLLPNLVVIFFIMRHRIHSILDPILFVLISAGFANTVIFFLFDLGYISVDKFSIFLLTESAFWVGVLITPAKEIIGFDNRRNETPAILERRLFYIFFSLTIALELIAISIGGIAIFNENRFSGYEIPAYKYLLKIKSIPQTYCWIYCFHLILNNKNSHNLLLGSCCVTVLFVFAFLTGSKSFIMVMVGAYFYYVFFYKGQIPKIKWIYIIPILISPIPIILTVYDVHSYGDAFMVLLQRFVQAGDIYWQSLCYNNIDHIANKAEWYQRVFSFILSPLGLSPESARTPIGNLVLNYVYPSQYDDLIGGANTRVPIYCYYLFKKMGWIFAIIIGAISTKLIFNKILSIPKGIVGTVVLAKLYGAGIEVITDPTVAISILTDLVIGIFLINIICFILAGTIQIKFR